MIYIYTPIYTSPGNALYAHVLFSFEPPEVSEGQVTKILFYGGYRTSHTVQHRLLGWEVTYVSVRGRIRGVAQHAPQHCIKLVPGTIEQR